MNGSQNQAAGVPGAQSNLPDATMRKLASVDKQDVSKELKVTSF